MGIIYWARLSHVNNTQIDVQEIDVVMSMYNLIKYRDNYLKTTLKVYGNITCARGKVIKSFSCNN